MPVYYHGTSHAFATAMRGTPINGAIDVTAGGGEFGRGFYTQASVSNAHRRGHAIYGNNGAVLIVDIDDALYHSLHFRTLTLNAAQMLNARLKGNQRNSYTTAHDVIVGPLVGQPRVMQQKFQSLTAQNLLNGQNTQRTVI